MHAVLQNAISHGGYMDIYIYDNQEKFEAVTVHLSIIRSPSYFRLVRWKYFSYC